MLVKFSTIAGGVFIEVNDRPEYADTDRCFRFDDRGNAEYALLGELKQDADRARWYGHAYKADAFTLA
jgi:hypothetical protein